MAQKKGLGRGQWKKTGITLFVLISALLYISIDRLSTETSVKISTTDEGASPATIPLIKGFYTLFPYELEWDWNELDMYSVAFEDRVELRYWIQVAGPEKVVGKIERDAQTEGRRGWCHLPAHYVAHLSHELFNLSPVEYRDTRCLFGFQHGLINTIIEHGQTDTGYILDLVSSCKSYIRIRDRTLCVHGIGEGLLQLVEYNLPKALATCDYVTKTSEEKKICNIGAFMRNATTLYPIFSLNHNSEWVSEDPFYPCNRLPGDKAEISACYMVQPLIMLKLNNQNFKQTMDWCLMLSGTYVNSCVQGIGLSSYIPPDIPEVQNLYSVCNQFSENDQLMSECMQGVVKLYVYFWGDNFYDDAKQFCQLFSKKMQNECIAYLNFLSN